MTIRKRLQSWMCNKQGVLPSIVRINLASMLITFYALVWFFILVITSFGFRSLSQLPIKELTQELFILFIFVTGLFALPTLHVVYVMVRRLEQRPLSSLGLRLSHYSFQKLLAGLALGITFASSGFLYLYWSGALKITGAPVTLSWELIGWLSLLVLGWFGIAFWEEVFFRGYMLQTLTSAIGIAPAVLITSLVFGALHIVTYGMKPSIFLSLAFFGIILAILYLRTKSLWAPIGFHFANNFWVFHILSVPLEQEMRLPFVTVNGYPVYLEPPRLLFHTDLVGGRNLTDLRWQDLSLSLIFYGVLVLLIWKLPWFRPHPEIEALWQQYVPIAQPGAQLKAWWARRKQGARDQTSPAG